MEEKRRTNITTEPKKIKHNNILRIDGNVNMLIFLLTITELHSIQTSHGRRQKQIAMYTY